MDETRYEQTKLEFGKIIVQKWRINPDRIYNIQIWPLKEGYYINPITNEMAFGDVIVKIYIRSKYNPKLIHIIDFIIKVRTGF